jgi:hypothetical protein
MYFQLDFGVQSTDGRRSLDGSVDVALRRPRSADLQISFRKLDAQTGDLGHGLFDAAFSRFGVMFFSDPYYLTSNGV